MCSLNPHEVSFCIFWLVLDWSFLSGIWTMVLACSLGPFLTSIGYPFPSLHLQGSAPLSLMSEVFSRPTIGGFCSLALLLFFNSICSLWLLIVILRQLILLLLKGVAQEVQQSPNEPSWNLKALYVEGVINWAKTAFRTGEKSWQAIHLTR